MVEIVFFSQAVVELTFQAIEFLKEEIFDSDRISGGLTEGVCVRG